MTAGVQTRLDGYGAYLNLAPFHALKAELARYRIDSLIQMLEKKREEGRILAFIRGLRLSAQVIYAVRNTISSAGLQADWGHLLDAQGEYCSPECDVIIHKPGCIAQWNGRKEPIMDFKFIDCREAIAVISCKSFTKSVDARYYKKLERYVDNVLLFSECCEPTAVDRLKHSAVKAGYQGFWYLYTWDRKSSIMQEDENVWLDFLNSLQQITNCAAGG